MRNNPDVHQLVNGQTKCGMSTHLNTIQQLEKKKENTDICYNKDVPQGHAK